MESVSSDVATTVLSGKKCIVTGGTSGIGKETALGLARLQGDVTIVGRSREKCETVRNEIISATSNRDVSYEIADLSSMDALRILAEKITSSTGHIDVLINNAGGVFNRYIVTKDGFESTIALNYLSPVLFTRLLFPILKLSGGARIINIGSSVHKNGRTEFDFQFEQKYGAMKAYSTSKLMITLFTYALARRLRKTNISSILVQPGFVSTNLGRNSRSRILSASFSIMKFFQISAYEASKTPINLATYGTNKELNGKCFSRLKPIKTSPVSYNEELQEKLWQLTADTLGLSPELP